MIFDQEVVETLHKTHIYTLTYLNKNVHEINLQVWKGIVRIPTVFKRGNRGTFNDMNGKTVQCGCSNSTDVNPAFQLSVLVQSYYKRKPECLEKHSFYHCCVDQFL